MLHNPIVFFGRFDHLATFNNIVRSRFFDVHVFAGLANPDRCEGMPVIRSGDRHHVDIVPIQNPAEISFGFKIMFLIIFEGLGLRSGYFFIRVAEDNHLGVRLVFQCVNVRLAASVDAQHGGAHFTVLIALCKNFDNG